MYAFHRRIKFTKESVSFFQRNLSFLKRHTHILVNTLTKHLHCYACVFSDFDARMGYLLIFWTPNLTELNNETMSFHKSIHDSFFLWNCSLVSGFSLVFLKRGHGTGALLPSYHFLLPPPLKSDAAFQELILRKKPVKLETAINNCFNHKTTTEKDDRNSTRTWFPYLEHSKLKQFVRKCHITWLIVLANELHDLGKFLISFYVMCY